ncbi:hypothetical protein AJ87_18460 [Rhizobium yanglingense]|nr:hypothetical protein AJ87_18460 [Rhizobium yanglingense]
MRIGKEPVRRRQAIGPPVTPRPSTFQGRGDVSAGHQLTLKGHSISAEGQVQPSVVCRHLGCDFHEFVVLDNWAQRRAAVPAIRTS